jgi:hypothetical protein
VPWWRDCTDTGIDSAIRITKDEFAHYHKEGILLGDDSGYLATLTMYHDLHCIVSYSLPVVKVKILTRLQRYLYQVLYPEYYFPNQTESERIARREHSGTYPYHHFKCSPR